MAFIREGEFAQYSQQTSNIIKESLDRTGSFNLSAICSGSGSTVFISHSHHDLSELGPFLLFLQNKYNVIPYIDSMDNGMPEHTCAATADKIKSVIAASSKFILLASEKALSSMWCNWEVGIADKSKYYANMAILPLLQKQESETAYKGNEYLSLYPYITKEHVNMYDDDYFVNFPQLGYKVTLKDWFLSKCLYHHRTYMF